MKESKTLFFYRLQQQILSKDDDSQWQVDDGHNYKATNEGKGQS